MKTLLKVVGVILAIPIAIIALWLAIGLIGVHFETRGKITAALESAFPGAAVTINDREDFDEVHQICFDVTAHPKSGGPTKREILMIGGDSDGGTWPIGRRGFSSMQECEKAFSRG